MATGISGVRLFPVPAAAHTSGAGADGNWLPRLSAGIEVGSSFILESLPNDAQPLDLALAGQHQQQVDILNTYRQDTPGCLACVNVDWSRCKTCTHLHAESGTGGSYLKGAS